MTIKPDRWRRTYRGLARSVSAHGFWLPGRRPLWWLVGLLLVQGAAAAPVRVSFLDTRAAREDTLLAFARAGCASENIAALRKAMIHYYRTPLALDVSAFPAATDGFHEFASIGDFVSALGTNQISFLPHDFELNCFDAALLLAGPETRTTASLSARDAPWLAVQVQSNYNEWLVPVASLGDLLALADQPHYVALVKDIAQFEFPEKHKILDAVFYQYQTLPLGTSSNTIAAETRDALQRHWKRGGIGFPAHVALVMLHRARVDAHLVVTDHMGALLKRDEGYLYLEKTGGRGPFLRIDVEDPADVAAYFSTMTWPDYPFNCLSVNGDLFLDVPLRPGPPPSAPAPAAAAP